MKSRTIITIFVLVCMTLACDQLTISTSPQNPPASVPTAAAPAATQASAAATNTPTLTPVALTDTPTLTPTVTATLTPAAPMLTPLKDPVNCHYSYSTAYEDVGAGLAVGVSTPILGKSQDGAWWEIASSTGKEKCWVAAAVTTATGDLSTVPVVMGPMAYVTNVTLTVSPPSVNLGVGCPGPYPTFSFKGTIYVNGPITVKWYFETQKGGPLPTQTTTFTKYGFQNVTGSYSPSSPNKGNYWVHLVIVSPNTMSAQDTYQIMCQ